jgi:hypothetical protein
LTKIPSHLSPTAQGSNGCERPDCVWDAGRPAHDFQATSIYDQGFLAQGWPQEPLDGHSALGELVSSSCSDSGELCTATRDGIFLCRRESRRFAIRSSCRRQSMPLSSSPQAIWQIGALSTRSCLTTRSTVRTLGLWSTMGARYAFRAAAAARNDSRQHPGAKAADTRAPSVV